MHRTFPSMMLASAAVCFAAPADAGYANEGTIHEGAAQAAPQVDTAALAALDSDEDYGSVTVIIDHLVTQQDSSKVTVKDVWSTESAHESLLAQMSYFGQAGLLTDPGILAVAAQGNDKSIIYVYTVSERQTQVIVDADVWASVLDREEFGNGSVLKAHASLIILATELVRAAKAQGEDTRLLAYVPENL